MSARTVDGRTAEQAVAMALASAAKVAAGAPSITDLGHHLAAVKKAQDLFDDANLARPERDNALRLFDGEIDLLCSRADAIRDLIATQPARSIADAAVAIAEACTIAARVSADGDMPVAATRAADKIERMLLAGLPFVAKAAGLDMEGLGWASSDHLRVMRFRAMGVRS